MHWYSAFPYEVNYYTHLYESYHKKIAKKRKLKSYLESNQLQSSDVHKHRLRFPNHRFRAQSIREDTDRPAGLPHCNHRLASLLCLLKLTTTKKAMSTKKTTNEKYSTQLLTITLSGDASSMIGTWGINAVGWKDNPTNYRKDFERAEEKFTLTV